MHESVTTEQPEYASATDDEAQHRKQRTADNEREIFHLGAVKETQDGL
jgi:hypothetical protein